jgi:hypothetical protein
LQNSAAMIGEEAAGFGDDAPFNPARQLVAIKRTTPLIDRPTEDQHEHDNIGGADSDRVRA